MADYTCYTKITRVRVYELSLPTDRDELYKALTGATNDWTRLNPGKSLAANNLMIESDGDKLTITFEISQEMD